MNKKRLILPLIMATTLAACASTKKESSDLDLIKQESDIMKPVKEISGEIVHFLNSKLFDESLSELFSKKEKQVVVEFSTPVTTAELPERIDQWLYAVKDGGGQIKVEQDPDRVSRGVVTEIISVVVGIYEYVSEKVTFSNAEEYDAKVYYDGGSGQITRVLFDRREP